MNIIPMMDERVYVLLVISVVVLGVVWGSGAGSNPKHRDQGVDEYVLERLASLEAQQRQSEAEINHLQKVTDKQSAMLKSQDDTIRDLKTTVAMQETTIAELTGQVVNLELELLRSSYIGNSNVNGSDMSMSSTSGNRMATQKTNDINQPHRVQRQAVEKMAFTVYNDVEIDHPAQGVVIKFNKVITNIGNGYDFQTGIFTANQDGLYLFIFAISEVDAYSQNSVVLLVNGQTKVEAIAETFHPHVDDQGANSAVLHLHGGDRVWIATSTVDDTTLIPGGARFSTFTGVFLY